MRKLGWVIIILWCLYELITLGPLRWPMMILKDPYSGSGYIIGQLIVLAFGIWLVNRKKKEERQRSISTLSIYKRAETEQLIHTDFDIKYLKETMSCPTCAFADQKAMNQGKPWCDAPQPPVIENNYCRTWKQAARGSGG